MAHGKSLTMREIKPARPEYVHKHPEPVKRRRGLALVFMKPGDMVPYVDPKPTRDRSLRGKARIRARKAGREIVAGFACGCGARAYLTAADDATAEGRRWFDELYDAHAGCDEVAS